MTQPSDTPRSYPPVCQAGHELHDDIVYVPRKGSAKWRCRVCLRAAYAKHYQQKRQKRLDEGWEPNKNRNMPPLATECSNGHPWTEATTYTSPTTKHRQCRVCRKARLKRNKAAASSASSESAQQTE